MKNMVELLSGSKGGLDPKVYLLIFLKFIQVRLSHHLPPIIACVMAVLSMSLHSFRYAASLACIFSDISAMLGATCSLVIVRCKRWLARMH